MKPPKVITLDFETKPIRQRPHYPPEPVSFSIQLPTERRPTFHAWGHAEGGNNTTKGKAAQVLKSAYRLGLPFLFHNAKFDTEVLLEAFDINLLDQWERIHDTMFLLYLEDPHQKDLKLKPAAERMLGEAPDEQDAVRDWVLRNKNMLVSKYGGTVKPSQVGEWIWAAPAPVVQPYANGDVSRTLGLFKYLYPSIAERDMLEAYDRERHLMPILLRNEREGMRVDQAGLRRDIKVYASALADTDAWLRKRLKAPSLNINSDQDFAEALAQARIVPDEAWTLTKGGQRSVSKDNLTLDMFTDPKVARAFGYRNRLTTCLSMFMEPWLEQAQENNGHITTNWNQVRQPSQGGKNQGTRTGRPSTNKHNFLNISKTWDDKEDGYEHPAHLGVPELPLTRRYILPDPGGLFCHRDYNQQELRILAHFEDGALLQAYLENLRVDVHDFVRDLILDITGQDWPRRPVKIVNFRTIYGGGAPATAAGVGCSMEEAKQLLAAHARALPGVKDLKAELKQMANRNEPLSTWGGREYFCEPPSFSKKYGREMTYEYKLLNYLVQGSAADATKEAIIRYHEHPGKHEDSRFMVTVYDEINISAPKGIHKEQMAVLRDAMESIEIDVPLLSDGKVGPNWGTLSKFKEPPSKWESN